MELFARARVWCGDAKRMRRLHGWLSIVWLAASFPLALAYGKSVLFVTWLSLYAIVTGHWSSWQAARAEVKVDETSGDGEVS